jgi:hypothetical protein
MAIGFTAELSHYTSVGRYAIQAIIPGPAAHDSAALPAAAPAIAEEHFIERLIEPPGCPLKGPPFIPHTWRCWTDLVTAEECCQGPTGMKICCPVPCPTRCGGLCVDTSTDSNNCGRCGNQCSSGEVCCNGSCVTAISGGYCWSTGYGCQFGMLECTPGVCQDVQGDPLNCGSCGNRCPSGTPTCCIGVCADVSTDANNCGACGTMCPTGGICVNATCTCPAPSSTVCGPYPGQCVDTATDHSNCGSCYNACGANETCCNGSCCPPPLSCCNNECIDPNTDSNNCGYCGNTCETVVGAGGCCNNGSCVSLPSLSSASSNPPGSCDSSSNTNYWLGAADCANISGLSVTIDPQPGLTANSFGLQLNAVPPLGNANEILWMQYVILVSNSTFLGIPTGTVVDAWVEYWSENPLCMSFATNADASPCCSTGDCCTSNCNTNIGTYLFPGTSSVDKFEISLSTDQNTGYVTQANFVVTDSFGGQNSLPVPIPTSVQAPIQAFQFVAVGYDNCAEANFASGSGASITYDVQSGQQLCVQGPSNSCSSLDTVTGEFSNATYGLMNACCGTQLQQTVSA